MQVTAKLRYLRIAPRKVRLVADLIRGKKVDKAQTILKFTVKKATHPILKLLNSAIANARNNFQLASDNLYISKITVDEGPKSKRWMPRARGQAYEIQKKTSHITLVLDQIDGDKKAKKRKIGKPKKIKKTESVAPRFEIKKQLSEEIEGKPQKQIKYRPEKEVVKPKIEKGLRRIFRRKAF